jgi:hypothetical protein
MKKFDEPNVFSNDKQTRQDILPNSKIVGFASFKEKKAEFEYKKAIQTILARAQKADW